MKRTFFALALTLFLMASLVLVPGARAALLGQETDKLDGPGVPARPDTVMGEVIAHDAYGPEGAAAHADAVQAYWTPERMAAAQPAPDFSVSAEDAGLLSEPLLADGTASFVNGINAGGVESATVNSGTLAGSSSQIPSLTYPFPFNRTGMNIPPAVKTFGKLFYTTWDGNNYYANAAVVTSGTHNYDMVITRGGDIHPGDGNAAHWSHTFLFCPNTSYGVNPYGCWADQTVFVTTGWYGGDLRSNVGMVDTYDGGGGHTAGSVADIVGAQGIAWNQPAFQEFWHAGYPYSGYAPAGQVVYFCTASLARLYTSVSGNQPMGMGCDLPDTWGGPWIINGKVANKGYIDGVATFKLNANDLYSPYFASYLGSFWTYAISYNG